MKELSSNIPINLNEKNDLFNYLNKVKIIKDFLENNEDFLLENNMIGLYGKWGSGKSSIIKTLIESQNQDYRIDETKYLSIFFEAWKYESDTNLAYSLFEFLIEKVNPNWKNGVKDRMEEVYAAIKGFAKGGTFNLGIVSFTGKDALEELEKLEQKRSQEESFYTRHKKFVDQFSDLLKEEKRKVIIFIDDLDRCETENIVKLLSAIKLFFTLSDKVVFLCGIDKEAVTKSLKSKYNNDEEKAEEYLEKIFSFSFSMPKISQFESLISSTFGTNENIVEDFFRKIKFDNPRHLKKVLNKYVIIAKIKKNKGIFESLIPNIITEKSTNNIDKICNTIFVLYIIILFEYHEEEYFDFKYYEKKISEYGRNISIITPKSPQLLRTENIKVDLKNIRLSDIKNIDKYKNNRISWFAIFTPRIKEPISIKGIIYSDGHAELENDFTEIFDENILNLFADFVMNRIVISCEKYTLDETYTFNNLFKMAETLL